MSDPNPSSSPLQRSLSQLHAELARTPKVDDASKQLLREVLGDIERLLRAGGMREAGAVGAADAMRATDGMRAADGMRAVPAGPGVSAASQSRLEALAVEFEADHPALAASLRQFVDLLGRAGL